MLFGLKNAGATYQRLVDKALDSQTGRNIEVYVDDLVIKSHTEAEMIRDIGETFRTLQKISMKLNPKKCTFGAVEGMFLGYMITPEGIKPFPDKTEAVLQLPSPRTIKEVKSLNGKLAKAEQAFKQLKQHLSELPLLVAPKPKEELIVYLSASYGAISVVLMTERGMVQTLVYFVSRALQGLELNYTPIEKLVLSLVFAANRLRRYFQAHPIAVITDQPIKQIMSHPNVLADFLAEMPDESPPDASIVETQQEPWTFFTDGSSCVDGSGARLILSSLEGTGIRRQRGKHGQVLGEGQKSSQRLLQLFYKPSTIKRKQESGCPEQDCVNQLCTLIQTGLGRSTQRKTHTKKGGDNRGRGRWIDVDDTNNRILERRDSSQCVGPLQSDYVIREIYEGSCSMHARTRSVVAKAIRMEYYWPTMHQDARYMIRTCNDCQIHRPVTRSPQQPLTPITAPWPFYKWGIDIAGPFPEAPGKVKFLIVAMDYFMKWIESKSVATITGNQSNGLIERENRSLREGIKARLGEGNKNWVEELPHVLWVHRIMIKLSHDDTPFSLTYGTEAVIPADIGMPAYRTAVVDIVHNNEELRLNLDLLEE
nr:reverse transcriptase domain-containing protein [Tanacetum cinerariifolium]